MEGWVRGRIDKMKEGLEVCSGRRGMMGMGKGFDGDRLKRMAKRKEINEGKGQL